MQTLKEIRKARGISINELARRAGVERTLVRFFETGERKEYINPRIETIISLADVLDVDAMLLFDIAKERMKEQDDFKERYKKLDEWMAEHPEKGYKGKGAE